MLSAVLAKKVLVEEIPNPGLSFPSASCVSLLVAFVDARALLDSD